MDFESLPSGTRFADDLDNFPSQLVLEEDGIRLFLEEFRLHRFVGFFEAQVVDGGDNALRLDNMSVLIDLDQVGFPVNSLTLEYMELGGNDNFAVNGGPILQLDDLTEIPTDIAPGVIATVDEGIITLTGLIDRVLIGGQELTIDTIVAVPEPASLVLLGVGGAWILRRTRRGTNFSRRAPRRQASLRQLPD